MYIYIYIYIYTVSMYMSSFVYTLRMVEWTLRIDFERYIWSKMRYDVGLR